MKLHLSEFVFAPFLVGMAALGFTNEPASSLHQRAEQIQKQILAFDSHLDLPFDYRSAAEDGPTEFDLPKAQRGGLKGAAIAVFVPQGPRTPEGYSRARQDAAKKYQLIRGIADQNPSRAELAYSPQDVRRIAGEGRFAVVLSLLNAYPLVSTAPREGPRNELNAPDDAAVQSDLRQIDEWYQRGVRIFGFVHAGHNDWADSSRPNAALGDGPQEHGGLSELGRQAVTRLNQLGVLIDVSQLSSPAFRQVLTLTKAPVAATHSAVKGLVDAPRNLSDEELELIAKNGGVVQVVAFSSYLRPVPANLQNQVKALQAEYGFVDGKPGPALAEAKQKEYSERFHKILSAAPKANLSQFVDAIAYAVKKIGIDHVGISSDFNHGGGVIGWENEGESTNVTEELLRRGFTELDIAKLWGGNFLRVWAEAQSRGETLSAEQRGRGAQ